jgi:hypothetical protein
VADMGIYTKPHFAQVAIILANFTGGFICNECYLGYLLLFGNFALPFLSTRENQLVVSLIFSSGDERSFLLRIKSRFNLPIVR